MDIKLNYIEAGQGETLILLHGNGESLEYFVYQIEYFSRKYRVIAIDTRGHGRSPRGEKPFTIRQFADDLYDFMIEHRVGKAHILGFSDGGNIAMIFAIKHPECVDKLILNGANLYSSGVKPTVQIPIILEYHMAKMFAKKSAELLGLMVNDPNLKPEDLKHITAKTLVIAGTNDMIKEKHTKLIYQSIENAELCLLPGDHFIAKKEYGVFNKELEQFLDFA